MAQNKSSSCSKVSVTQRNCEHCKSLYKPETYGQKYCSDLCRIRAHRQRKKETLKPSLSRQKRLEKKLNKLSVNGFGLWLAEQCRRCGTVEILQGHTKDSLSELFKLKCAASQSSEFSEGRNRGGYHLSHIFPANADKSRIGLLVPTNLVICPEGWNRKNRGGLPSEQDDSLSLSRSSLSKRWRVQPELSVQSILKLIRKFLGKGFDDWLSGVQIPLSQRQQLMKKLNSLGVKVGTNASLEELQTKAEELDLPVHSFSRNKKDVLQVIASEQDRLGISPSSSLYIAIRKALDWTYSLEGGPPMYERDKGEIDLFLIDQALRQLHRQEYTLGYRWIGDDGLGNVKAAKLHILEVFDTLEKWLDLGRPEHRQDGSSSFSAVREEVEDDDVL